MCSDENSDPKINFGAAPSFGPGPGGEFGDGAPGVPGETESIQGKLATAKQLVSHVHAHMSQSHIHECRKLMDAMRIIADVKSDLHQTLGQR